MKKPQNILFLISLFCLAITGGINILGYLYLPEVIATQISFTGGGVNTMPKIYYLIGGFVLSLILTVMVNKSKDEKLKWFLVNVLITVANCVMVLIQL